LSSSFPLVSVADDDIIRILCVVRQHDNRDEDEDDDEGGFRVIGTTCAHNIASVIVVVVKLCCVLSVSRKKSILKSALSLSIFSMFLLSDDDALSAPSFLRVLCVLILSQSSFPSFFFNSFPTSCSKQSPI
jgi:hypothetical protein